jgi:tRNA (cmo5U34)-methyltransferase
MMHNKFDFQKVEDFDNHLNLSIPNYQGLYDVFRAIALEYMPPEGKCVDIGCSTGKFLNDLSASTEGLYVGIDVVEMASEKNFVFLNQDVITALENFTSVDMIVSMFTLQFLGKYKRQQVVKKLKELIDNGATLLLAEKVFSDTAKLNSIMTKEHYNQKRKHFTDTEILDKDYSLIGKMFCLTNAEITEELKYLGHADQVWQSYNFRGWVVRR